MNERMQSDSLRGLLANMQADVIVANVQQVEADWRRENYVHSFNRLYYILEGEGRVEVDGVAYEPQPGQLVLLPCHTIQSYSTVSDRTFRKYWCHFTARIGSRDLMEMRRFPVCVDVPEPLEAEGWFRRIVEGMSDPSPAALLRTQAALLQLLSLFMNSSQEQPTGLPTAARKMSLALQYIEQHLDEKITIDRLAALVHYHPNYFIRAFHSVLGCSPIQYMNRLRMERARKLLATDQSIGSIARAVGIEQHNFSAMFKSCTGFSPRDFRRLLRR